MVHASLTKPSVRRPIEHLRWDSLERGMLDVGHHLVIDRTGGQHLIRPLDVMGCHTPGFNHKAISVCLMGGLSEEGSIEDNFTVEQKGALTIIVALFLKEHPEGQVKTPRSVNRLRGESRKEPIDIVPLVETATRMVPHVTTLSAVYTRTRPRRPVPHE